MEKKASNLRKPHFSHPSSIVSQHCDHHLSSSRIFKWPHCALTFCDLLNERTPSSKTDRIAWPGLALSQPQAHRVIISSCQECREFPAFSLSSGLVSGRASERACDGSLFACWAAGRQAVSTHAWYQQVCRSSASKVHLQLPGPRREQT